MILLAFEDYELVNRELHHILFGIGMKKNASTAIPVTDHSALACSV
jgi:hypothetical protein